MNCRICKEKKKIVADGLCNNCYHREYRKKKRDKLSKYHKKYNAKYYRKNKEILHEKQKEFIMKKTAKGICAVYSCNNPIDSGRSNFYCIEHRKRNNDYGKKRRDFRKTNGLCQWCGKPLDGTSICYCKACQNKYNRNRKKRKKLLLKQKTSTSSVLQN